MYMKKRIGLSLVFLVLFSLLSVGVLAQFVRPEWEVRFDNSLSGFKDSFYAGLGGRLDLIQPPVLGSGIEMTTEIDGYILMRDYREDDLKWEITMSIYSDSGIEGVNVLTWNFDNVPSNIKLVLIDYGDDDDRKRVVRKINLKGKNKYEFDVDNAKGKYRFLDLIAKEVEIEDDDNVDNGGNRGPKGHGGSGNSGSEQMTVDLIEISRITGSAVKELGESNLNKSKIVLPIILVVVSLLLVIFLLRNYEKRKFKKSVESEEMKPLVDK